MRVLTVRELTSHIKSLLENDRLLSGLWVKGEISNFKRAASGHVYFTLKDHFSCVRVVMFRSRARRLLFQPEDGMSVLVRGYISLYERDGQYQLYAEELEPDGAGALYAALEKLKSKLAAEGLFDRERKRKLPRFPRCIGLVTSPAGAAVRDMVNITRRRWPVARILLAPVTVQGENAPAEIARAIALVNKLAEVELIIVGRGGGSLEELWAFNTEVVARSIAASRIPVISAVGHETDFTIADLVADLRAPTPSAAAEMAVPDRLEVRRSVDAYCTRMRHHMRQCLAVYRQRLEYCTKKRVLVKPAAALCDQRRQTVDLLARHLRQGAAENLRALNSRLSLLTGRLHALSPLATMARGYSFTTGPDGGVLREAAQVQIGDPVTVHLYRGMLECTVRNKRESSN